MQHNFNPGNIESQHTQLYKADLSLLHKTQNLYATNHILKYESFKVHKLFLQTPIVFLIYLAFMGQCKSTIYPCQNGQFPQISQKKKKIFYIFQNLQKAKFCQTTNF